MKELDELYNKLTDEDKERVMLIAHYSLMNNSSEIEDDLEVSIDDQELLLLKLTPAWAENHLRNLEKATGRSK